MRAMFLNTVPKLDYACTEAINTLATNLTFAGSQFKTIMLTSCAPGEGKSYITFHLTKALANMGYSCVMVDADIRKSVFLSRYDAQIAGARVGLTHYLAGKCEQEAVLYKVENENFCVIPSGKEVINSLPLLTSYAFTQLLQTLKSQFDFVIVDAPPVGLVIDAAMIASACDGTLFVTTNGRSKRELSDCIKQVQKSQTEILGVVLNKVTLETHKSRKYYYRAQYSHYGNGEYIKSPNNERKTAGLPFQGGAR